MPCSGTGQKCLDRSHVPVHCDPNQTCSHPFQIQCPLVQWCRHPLTPKIRVCSVIFILAQPPPRRGAASHPGPHPVCPSPALMPAPGASLSTCASGSFGSQTREDRPQWPTSLVLSALDLLVLRPWAAGARMGLPVLVPVPLTSRLTRVLTCAESPFPSVPGSGEATGPIPTPAAQGRPWPPIWTTAGQRAGLPPGHLRTFPTLTSE